MTYLADSFSEVSTTKVAFACDLFLNETKEIADKLCETLIEEQMNKSWFPSKTRELAIFKLQYRQQSLYCYFKYSYLYDEKCIVNSLSALTKIAGPKILLNARAAIILKEYFPTI